MLRILAAFLVFTAVFSSTSVSSAGQASDQIKQSVDRIIAVLRDPALRTPAKALDRRNMIFKVVEERFDFTEMAKRSLGESWSKLKDAEQKDYEVAFASLVENTYIGKIEKYSGEKIEIASEKPKGDRYVVVHTEIVTTNRKIPVDYSVSEAGGQWLVYDVNIEGMSLVTNYRTQFSETFGKDGFSGLMKIIAEKQKNLDAAS